MRVEAVKEITPQLMAALARLLPQLNPKLGMPDKERLQRLIKDPAATLLIAINDDDIIGTTTVIVYTTPFWIKARLDEVVVDEHTRGKGVGRALVSAALDVARGMGAQIAGLQPAVHREAANQLYLRMGFQRRETNVYRIVL